METMNVMERHEYGLSLAGDDAVEGQGGYSVAASGTGLSASSSTFGSMGTAGTLGTVRGTAGTLGCCCGETVH